MNTQTTSGMSPLLQPISAVKQEKISDESMDVESFSFSDDETNQSDTSSFGTKCGTIYIADSTKYTLICELCRGKYETMSTFAKHIKKEHMPHYSTESIAAEAVEIKLENSVQEGKANNLTSASNPKPEDDASDDMETPYWARYRQMRIVDGAFFQVVPEKCTAKNIVAMCKKCQPEVVLVKGHRRSTSNFLYHLTRKHGENALSEYKKYIGSQRKDTTAPYLCNDGSRKIKIVNKSIKITQNEFEKKMCQFIVNAMVPFRIVEDKYLLELFQMLRIDDWGLRVPNHWTLVKKMSELYEMNQNNMRTVFKDVEHVCMTVDVWSEGQRSFVSVTVHWINADYKRESAVLAYRRWPKTKTAQSIATMVERILFNCSLTNQKITATVTNNLFDLANAFKLIGVEYKGLKRSNRGSDSDLATKSAKNYFDDLSESESSDSELVHISPNNCTTEIGKCLLNHFQCISYNLHLCATADVVKCLSQTPYVDIHKRIMEKLNALWSCAAQPQTAETIKQVLGCYLSRPNETKWNSLLNALKQLSDNREKIIELQRQLNIHPLIDTEFEYITEFMECSEPLVNMLDILLGIDDIFFGMLIPALVALRRKLQVLRQKRWVHCRFLVDGYISSIETRFSDYLNISTPVAEVAVTAAFSNPLFKKRWLPCIDSSHHDRLLSLFKTAVIKEIADDAAGTSAETTEKAHSIEQNSSTYLDFFDFGGNDVTDSKSNQNESKAEIQILKYFCDSCNEIKCLNSYPAIKKVFYKTNTPLPSSTPVERLFSTVSMLDKSADRRLRDEQYEMRAVLKAKTF